MEEKTDILFIDLTYFVNDPTGFKCESNVAEEKRAEVIREFVRAQMGAGKDSRRANDKDEYHIRLELDLSNDSFECQYNTGNKGLREGILLKVAEIMDRKTE